MEIRSIESFFAYYSRIKQRTQRLFSLIPPDQIEWSYQAGKFTIGDLIRHLANIERYMYVETLLGRPSAYKGCGENYANGYDAVISYYDQLYQESRDLLSSLTEEDLHKKCSTPAGIPITRWKWMRAMVEHEIHHRGQLYTYLGILGIPVPPIFGLTSEEVAEKSK